MVAADTLRSSGLIEAHPPGFGPGFVPGFVVAGFDAARDAALAYLGNTAPNPPVGCAILDQHGAILAVGGHEKAGAPHAEAMALSRLRESGRSAEARRLLVTLEPCNHQGRTGPCTEAILASPVREVWIGCSDPNPRVTGHGAARLAEAGLSVRTLPAGRLRRDCEALILPFRSWASRRRPWITVKQALDATGGMIPPPGARTFTSAASLHLAHRLRRATDAIVTGTGTILSDLPSLTVRHLADHPGRRRVLAIVGGSALPEDYLAAAAARGFDVRRVPSPDALPALLGAAGVLWAMVEAGPSLLRSLRDAGLWDDQLTIRRAASADAPDILSVETAEPGGPTPLALLPELAALDQEEPCSRES